MLMLLLKVAGECEPDGVPGLRTVRGPIGVEDQVRLQVSSVVVSRVEVGYDPRRDAEAAQDCRDRQQPAVVSEDASYSISDSIERSMRGISSARGPFDLLTIVFFHEDSRTGVEDAGEHPALGEAHGHSAVKVLQQNLDTSCPGRRRRAHGVVVAPVSNQHAIIVLSIDLREEQGPAPLARLALRLALSFWAR